MDAAYMAYREIRIEENRKRRLRIVRRQRIILALVIAIIIFCQSIYNRNIKLGEYGILETYCIHNVSEFMDKTVLKEWPKICNDCNKLYCIQDTKKGEEFILNKYTCSTCKFLSFCNGYKDVIRNCYMNYFIDYYTNRKCILRPVLEYIKKKVDDER